MLNLANNRLSYGDMLLPPVNFHLDFAIGTTYSLDLDSLVGASLFLLSGGINSDRLNNDILSLDSLIKNTNKIVLFCESGQIHFNNKTNPIYILLENMIFQVTKDNSSEYLKYASFHPKFWLLRFEDEENNVLYRLIVLSKNLTFNRSWDVSFAIDGKIDGKIDEKNDENKSLQSFINYLSSKVDDDKSEKMDKIARELKDVNFDLDNPVFDSFDFILNGVEDDYNVQNQLLFKQESIDELLIISPFLSDKVIRKFNERISPNNRAILITQSDSLIGWKPEYCSNFDVYIVRGEIIDGESFLPKDSQETLPQDIHAKVYVAQYGRLTEFYLGSLNATCNALKNNVEVMAKLTTTSDKLNVKQILESLFDVDGENPFEKIDWDLISNDDAEQEVDFEEYIKYIVRLDSKANVISYDDYYNIELGFENIDMEYLKDLNITIQPLFVEKTFKLNSKIIFKNLTKKELSEFFIIRINNELSRIIKIKTKGMPEDRLNDVISSVIDNPVDFLLYVSYLLGDEFVFDDFDFDNDRNSPKNGNYIEIFPELYEKMLKASFYNREKFDDLEILIEALSNEDIMPKGFKELYDTFKRVLDENA